MSILLIYSVLKTLWFEKEYHIVVSLKVIFTSMQPGTGGLSVSDYIVINK